MTCPHCDSCIWTLVQCDMVYTMDPYSFREGDIFHIHDFNPRVATWRCSNNHEFKKEGRLRCTGCFTEDLNRRNLPLEDEID